MAAPAISGGSTAQSTPTVKTTCRLTIHGRPVFRGLHEFARRVQARHADWSWTKCLAFARLTLQRQHLKTRSQTALELHT
jgi:hypothetical protein